MVSVSELRKAGNKVRVLHHRNTANDGSISCKGGKTIVEITTKDGLDFSGVANCRDDERYSKKMGVKIALGRAISLIPMKCRPDWFITKGGPCGLARNST